MDFWSILDPSESPKTLKNQRFFNMFAFSPWSLVRSISDRFGLQFGPPKSLQNGSEIWSETYQKSCSFLNAIQDLPNSIFGPTWPQLDPQDEPKMAPKSLPKRSQNVPKTILEAGSVPKPILDRSWTVFWPILAPFCHPQTAPKWVRNRTWKVSKIMFVFERHPGPPKIDFWTNWTPNWPPRGPQDEPKMAPKSLPKRSKNEVGNCCFGFST